MDRYAYPRLVRRGLGYLTPFPDMPADDREPVRGGWRPHGPGHQAPGSTGDLRPPL